MEMTEIVLLAGSAMLAGGINAVAGGGTLVTFPALLSMGVSGVVANASSTVALVIGTGGSMVGFRKLIPGIRQWLLRFLPISLLGGLVGSELLTRTNPAVFERWIPGLILFATLLFMVQGLVRRRQERMAARASEERISDPNLRRVRVWPLVIFQFFVALYGGYFGAGIGILMLASFGMMGMDHIHEMNALKNVLGSLINVVASVLFILTPGLVDWSRTGVMAVGALVGYYLGAHYSQRVPQGVVRKLIAVIGLSAFLVTAWQQFGGN